MKPEEQALREACWEEHRILLQCYREWDQCGNCSGMLWERICEHTTTLSVLRAQLTREFHTDLHVEGTCRG